MSQVMGVGVIGAGNISSAYLGLSKMFKGIEMRAVADLNMDTAKAQAEKFDVRAETVDDMLAASDIDIIVNLTIPAAHYEVSKRVLEAGKHVFSEKPFVLSVEEGRNLLDLAESKGLRVGSAPDTFLGGAHQRARALIDSGDLGQITGGTAAVMSRGMEMWHPNPDFFFKAGGGPVLDIGPYYVTDLVQLIGPVTRVACFSSTPRTKREITSEPRKGEFVDVETPTSLRAILEFANGATVNLSTSWDVHRHGLAPIELYGEKGSLFVPDPNFFGGEVRATDGGDDRDLPAFDHPFGVPNQQHNEGMMANYRTAGLADMAAAIAEGRPHRCGQDLSLHVMEVLLAIIEAGALGEVVSISSTCERPAALSASDASALMAAK